MLLQGQRTRSSRWSDDHPGSRREPDTGRRGLDIPGTTNEARTAICCHNVPQSSGCENLIREPDWNAGCAERRCPVWVRAGMKPTVERQQGASFDSHLARRAPATPRVCHRRPPPAGAFTSSCPGRVAFLGMQPHVEVAVPPAVLRVHQSISRWNSPARGAARSLRATPVPGP